jgi:hypothetical protein
VKQCSEPIAAAAGNERIEDGCNASTVLTYASGPQFSSKKLPVLSFGSAIIATTLVTVEVFAGPRWYMPNSLRLLEFSIAWSGLLFFALRTDLRSATSRTSWQAAKWLVPVACFAALLVPWILPRIY